ncbi:MAG: hypothetical protein DRO12_05045 [Thermoprotei archaeon]|nr:MAG: hypothetical protein DRO12_05045 [Thermoprotei archaeon]
MGRGRFKHSCGGRLITLYVFKSVPKPRWVRVGLFCTKCHAVILPDYPDAWIEYTVREEDEAERLRLEFYLTGE